MSKRVRPYQSLFTKRKLRHNKVAYSAEVTQLGLGPQQPPNQNLALHHRLHRLSQKDTQTKHSAALKALPVWLGWWAGRAFRVF